MHCYLLSSEQKSPPRNQQLLPTALLAHPISHLIVLSFWSSQFMVSMPLSSYSSEVATKTFNLPVPRNHPRPICKPILHSSFSKPREIRYLWQAKSKLVETWKHKLFALKIYAYKLFISIILKVWTLLSSLGEKLNIIRMRREWGWSAQLQQWAPCGWFEQMIY